jgi:transcription factor TFIIIB component B''
MDLDFDDQPSDHAAPAGNWGFLLSTFISFMAFCLMWLKLMNLDLIVRAGARFKPKGRPQPKKKQVSLSTTQTTLSPDVAQEKLSTQSEDLVPLDGSSEIPSSFVSSLNQLVYYYMLF